MPPKKLLTTLLALQFLLNASFLQAPLALAAAALPVTSVVKIVVPFYQSGSGFVIDTQKGYILTNAHVVLHEYTSKPWGNYRVCVTNASDQEASCDYNAKLIYADVDKDLALIQITGSGSNAPAFDKPAVDIQNAQIIDVGESMTALGFPAVGGTTITATQGIASGFKTIEGDGDINTSVIKTDASVMQGVSGGLVLDAEGNFAGIPAGYSEDENGNKIGTVITAKEVKDWFNKIIAEVSQTNFPAPKISKAYPAEVSGIKLKKLSGNSVTLSWDSVIANAPIDHYILSYDSKEVFGRGLNSWEDYPNFTKIPAGTGSYIINNLDPTKIYYVTMSAFDVNGNSTGGWSDEVTVNMVSGEMNDRIFYDVGENHVNALAIKRLKNYGTVNGYPDGTFRPDNTINRAELVKMMVEGQYNEIDAKKYNNCFPDVKDEWFAPYVCFAKEKGWISGYSDNSFKPAQSVNYAETLKIILKAYNMPTNKSLPILLSSAFPQPLKSQWYSQYVAFASDLEILPEGLQTVRMDEKVSRGKVAEILYRTIVTYKVVDNYSVSPWKDSQGNEIDVAGYYGLNAGKLTYKELDADGAASSVEQTIAKGCKTSPETDCYSQKAPDETDEIRFLNDKIQLLNALTKTLSFNYMRPLNVLTKYNFVQYFRLKNPLSIKVGQYEGKFYDGYVVSNYLGNEKIKTAAGEFDAVKQEIITVFAGTLNIDSYTGASMLITTDEIKYFAKNIGMVKSTTDVVDYMNGIKLPKISIQKELEKIE